MMLILLLRLLSGKRLRSCANSGVHTAFNLRVLKIIGMLFNAISNSGISISASGFASMFAVASKSVLL